jgi:transposase
MSRFPQDREQRKVSVGQAMKAMVLNGLGVVNQRLYLVPHFFENKPTERLLGPGVEPRHLNDDTLGRARPPSGCFTPSPPGLNEKLPKDGGFHP